MKLYHIVAMSENQVIAKAGVIPWMIREDLQRFKTLTAGHPIIMGSLTFESIKKQPLKGRLNIVLSRKDTILFEGRPFSYEEYGVSLPGGSMVLTFEVKGTKVVYARSVADALRYCEGQSEVYIIGGGEIYRETLDMVHELRLTIVHRDVAIDDTCVYYPEVDDSIWYPSYTEAGDSHSYVDYVRLPTP